MWWMCTWQSGGMARRRRAAGRWQPCRGTAAAGCQKLGEGAGENVLTPHSSTTVVQVQEGNSTALKGCTWRGGRTRCCLGRRFDGGEGSAVDKTVTRRSHTTGRFVRAREGGRGSEERQGVGGEGSRAFGPQAESSFSRCRRWQVGCALCGLWARGGGWGGGWESTSEHLQESKPVR